MKVISSKKYYSVYWYPTIFHQEKEHRTVQPEPIDISDESTAHEYYLFIEEEKDPHRKDVYNIHYYLSKNRKSLQEIKLDKKCISFVFQYIKHSRNGFVVYSYDRDALLKAFWDQYGQQGSSLIKKKLSSLLRKQGNPKPTQTEIDNYPVDRILLNCYHHSKNFYHEHEVQEEADGKLEAYYYVLNKKNNKREYLTTVPELFPKNHNVLNWFLDQFEKQFVKYAKQVSKTYRFYSAQVNVFSLLCDRYTEITTSNNKDKIDRLLTILRWQDKVRQLWESNFNSFIESKDYKAFWIENMKSLQKAEIDKEKEEIENLVKLIPTFRINLQYRRLKILETICGNAITEYAYCKTLIESKYNEKYDYSLPVSEKEIKCLIDYYENKTQCDDDLLLRDMCRKKLLIFEIAFDILKA